MSDGFTIRAATLNAEARTVEAIIATENPVAVFDPVRQTVIDEVLMAEGYDGGTDAPAFVDHSRVNPQRGENRYLTADLIGSARAMHRNGAQIVGTLHFADGDALAESTFNKVRGGHLKGVSPGYRVHERVELRPGETKVVNGRSFTANRQRPMRISTRWGIREVSVLPFQADAVAQVRCYAAEPYQEPDMELSTAPAADAVQTAVRSESPLQAVTPAPIDAVRAAPVGVAPVASAVDADAIRTAERSRIAMCRSEAVAGVPDDLVLRAESEGWDENRVRREYLAAVRGAQPATPVSAAPAIGHIADRDRDMSRQNLAGALMQRCGIDPAPLCRSEADTQAWERAMNEGERYMAFSMFDLCREAVRQSGAVDPDTGMQPNSQEGFIRAAFSTPTLSYAFTSSVNARILARYEEASAQLDFVEMVDVPDFKQNEAISLGKQSGLDKLPRGKTAKHATFADAQETFKIARYAKQLVIDDQDIIDDRLDVFSTVPDEFGLAAARLMPDLVFYLLMSNPLLADGTAVFDNGRGNNATDTFASDKLKLGVTAMRKQKENGVNLNINPQYLITASALEFQARELLGSANLLLAGTSGSVIERGTRNVVADIGLQLRTDARIDNGVTDPDSGSSVAGSATAWFLASRAFRTIRGAYRTGTGRRPQLRRFTLDRGQWGIGWDIAMDCGAKIIGYRGLYRGNA